MIKRFVVLASGNGSNLDAILEACENGNLPGKVVAVISDRKSAFALERASKHNVPAICHAWKPYREAKRSREHYDSVLAEIAAGYEPDYVILAGWMRLLTMPFLSRFPMRVINLHPALPGTFPGTHAIQRAFDAFRYGEITETGVMVHFVPDEGVDDGPLINQTTVPIRKTDTLDDLESRIHAVEHRLIIAALRQVIQNEP